MKIILVDDKEDMKVGLTTLSRHPNAAVFMAFSLLGFIVFFFAIFGAATLGRGEVPLYQDGIISTRVDTSVPLTVAGIQIEQSTSTTPLRTKPTLTVGTVSVPVEANTAERSTTTIVSETQLNIPPPSDLDPQL